MNTIPENTPQKQCSKCKKWHPATLPFFHNDKHRPDGLTNQCANCRNAKHQESRKLPVNQERERTYQLEYLSHPDIKERYKSNRKVYNARPEIKERNQNYGKIYRSQPDVKAREKERDQAYRNDPEIQSRELAYRKEYYQREDVKARYRVHSRNRTAMKKQIQGTYTTEQIQEQLKRQKYRCYYAACGFAKFAKVNGKYVYHIEHTYPLSRAIGTNIPANDISYIVLACPSCNQSKSDKLPHEWPEGGRLF